MSLAGTFNVGSRLDRVRYIANIEMPLVCPGFLALVLEALGLQWLGFVRSVDTVCVDIYSQNVVVLNEYPVLSIIFYDNVFRGQAGHPATRASWPPQKTYQKLENSYFNISTTTQ